jgi:dihydroflavonol-4-reductase
MKIAVVGATGFLGRHVVAELLDGYSVVAISRSGRMPPGLSRSAQAGVTVVSADVTDPASLEAAFAGCHAVVHSAGRVSHEPSDAAEMWEVHVEGTLHVAHAAKAAGARRLIHLSSSGTIGVSKTDEVSNEDCAPPLSVVQSWSYYRAKLFAEQELAARGPEGLDVITLNPSLLLGPGDDVRGSSTGPVRVFLDGGVPMSPPGGVSFVDVRDVADAVKRALRSGKPGRRYLLGGANLPFHQFYQRLARISGKPAPVAAMPRVARSVLSWLPNLGRDDDIGFGVKVDRWSLDLACHYWYIDWSRAEDELGWQPRDPLQTLEDTVFDILERRAQAVQRFAPSS